jgi:hypothetical protein
MSSRQGEWQRVQDAQGRYFYVNHATREVRLRLLLHLALLPSRRALGGTRAAVV